MPRDLEFYQRLTKAANRIARAELGRRDTCILTSAALWETLCTLGIPAECLRVRTAVHGRENKPRQYGCVLGGDGDGVRQPAAKLDHWHGHLVVIAERCWLLDRTLDQVNQGHRHLCARPFVAEVSPAFLAGEEYVQMTTGPRESLVSYLAYPGRGGWKHAPDFRPRRRKDIVRRLLEWVKAYEATLTIARLNEDRPSAGCASGNICASRDFHPIPVRLRNSSVVLPDFFCAAADSADIGRNPKPF